MGFLDSLLNKGTRMVKKAAKEAMVDAADEIIRGLVNDGKETSTTRTTTATGTTTTAKSVSGNSTVPAGYESVKDADVEDKLRAVFAKEFPQYEIKENVSPVTLGGTGRFMDYSFGVYENGEPKLFIMIISSNTCASKFYRWSKEQAEQANVTMINFVGAFENKMDYIINRLHQYL